MNLLFYRSHNQCCAQTFRRKEEEKEEDLHQAQENRSQAQKETQGPSRILQRRQHRKDLQAEDRVREMPSW